MDPCNTSSSLNVTANNEELDWTQPPWHKLSDVMGWVTCWVLGIIYTYVVVIIIMRFKQIDNKAYYLCLINTAVYDLGNLLRTSLYRSPSFAVGEAAVWIYWFVLQFLWYGQLFSVALLTLNRVFSVIFWQYYKQMITTKVMLVSSLITFLAGLGCALPVLFSFGRFVVRGCMGDIIFWDLSESYMIVEFILSLGIPLFNTSLYVLLATFLFIRRKKMNQQDSNNVEMKILIQSFLIALLQMCVIGSAYLHYIVPWNVGSAINNWIAIFSSGMNPFLYVVFSSQIREFLVQSFPKLIRNKIKPEPSTTKVTSSVKTKTTAHQ